MNHCTIAAANEHLPTWSPAWHLECEARYLIRAGGLHERRTALERPARVGRRDALEREMKRLLGLECR